LLAVLVVLACAGLAGGSVARADDFSGQISTPLGSCSYQLSAEDGSWSATLTCGSVASATASGSYDVHALTIDEVDVTTAVGDKNIAVGATLQLPEDVSQAAQAVAFWQDAATQIAGEVAINQPMQYIDDAASDITQAFGFDSVDSGLNQTNCDLVPVETASVLCRKLAGQAPGAFGIWLVPGAAGAGTADEGAEQTAACPPLGADPPSSVFVVCVPTELAGTLDVGSKTLLVLPGGALLALPIGAVAGSTQPELKSSGSIVFVGGALTGAGVKLDAGGNIQFAASAIGTVGPLTMTAGGRVDIGRFDLSSLPSLVNWAVGDLALLAPAPSGDGDSPLWDGLQAGIGKAQSALQQKHGILPAVVDAPSVTIQAKAGSVESGSLVATDGFGGEGALWGGDGKAPGGAAENFGASHGGYGGFPINVAPADAYTTLGGRGPAVDSPFDPQSPGYGGGGTDNAMGLSGGGVVHATVSGEFTVNGTLEAQGDGPGRCGTCGDHGGGGAGGAVNLRVGTFTGTGTVAADGGGFCGTCANGGGGLGGGGRIAVRYDTSVFKGKIHAWGGSDAQYRKGQFDNGSLDGRGGAGTVFLLASGKQGSPKPAFPGGTLIIDGGGSGYPMADGTPIPNGWSASNRELLVTNGARVYATTLNFGHLSVTGGAEVTTPPGSTTLTVGAKLLVVGPGGRIDVNGRGYAGGDDADTAHDAAGATAPGVVPATNLYGGSHGGIGGAPLDGSSGHRGATYDDPKNPHLPGAGGGGYAGFDSGGATRGGGVLLVTATTVTLDGSLLADGQDGVGPNLYDWSTLDLTDGGGAGGSVQLHAQTLAGGGLIAATGGSLCPGKAFLITNVICSNDTGGAGGGGRVAVYAPTHSGFHGKFLVLGGVNSDHPTRQNTGGLGTTYHSWP
jgi:hypothetical protein